MIRIANKHKKSIIEHALQSGQQEGCGILTGRNDRVERVHKMSNTSDSPETCYFMDPKEQLKIFKLIREQGVELVGIYHSHPNSVAYPSERDVELALYPEASYLIVSLQDPGKPVLRAFKIIEGKITEEEIKA
jgi:proteasome lid subunit RPN8/RPN11